MRRRALVCSTSRTAKPSICCRLLSCPCCSLQPEPYLPCGAYRFEAFPGHKHLPFCWATNILHLTLIRHNELITNTFGSVRCLKTILHKTCTPRLTSYTSEKCVSRLTNNVKTSAYLHICTFANEASAHKSATLPCNFATQKRVLTA